MNKIWCCAVLALTLSGCSLPIFSPQGDKEEPKVAITKQQALAEWLQRSATMMQSNAAERQRALTTIPESNSLERALWLSHPQASHQQRQQAQLLMKQHLPEADNEVQELFAIYQGYNQALLNLYQQVVNRQQEINTLTRQLKELASIDQQINKRKFQE